MKQIMLKPLLTIGESILFKGKECKIHAIEKEIKTERMAA